MLRKQCESNSTFAVFTPYPAGANTSECLPDQPCRLNCAGCSVSAFVTDLENGEHVIEYFVTGASTCLQLISEIVFDSRVALGGGVGAEFCELKCDDASCGFVAPYSQQFVELTHDDSTDTSESSLSSTAARDAKCRVTKDQCSKAHRLVLPLSGAHRGVALHVPKGFDVTTATAWLRDSHCNATCELKLPVPTCSELPEQPCGGAPCDDGASASHSSKSGKSGKSGKSSKTVKAKTTTSENDYAVSPLAQLALKGQDAADVGACETPSAAWLAAHQSVADERVAARAWANAVDAELAALISCHAQAVSSVELQVISLPDDGKNSCDYGQCQASLDLASPLTGNHPPTTVTQFLARAAELSLAARHFYSQGRYTQARQSSCCAEAIVQNILARYQCAETHCSLATIYPGAGSIEAYAALLDGKGADGRRRKRQEDTDAPYDLAKAANADQESAAGQYIVLFEECDAPHGSFVPDNDINDAVFAVSASSIVEARSNGAWLATTVHLAPIALGSLRDFALDLRFADAGLPSGAQVRLIHYGTAATETCYTVNSLADETLECPSANSVRLFRSLRAALPQHEAVADSPYINTQRNAPASPPAHITSLFVTLPRHYHKTPAFKLAFELRDRSSSCLVQTLRWNGAQKERGIGLIVPAPFRYPLEGIPAYFNDSMIPRGGLCVGGDNARARCNEAQECDGGYCEMHGDNAFHCVDAPQPGVNTDALCSRSSQCPYGTCYSYDGIDDDRGAYPLLEHFLESAGTTDADWYKTLSSDQEIYYDRSPHDSRRRKL